MRVRDITWVAGILEGEGYFGFRNSPTIRLSMTDKDTVEKIKNLMARNRIVYKFRSPSENPKHGQKYTFSIHGTTAIQWMMTIYSLMSIRRKAKIREIINSWRSMRNKQFATYYEKTH